MDRRRWHSGDPLYQQVLTARREIERLDVLLMRISLVPGRRHRAASRRARLSAARLHAAKR